VSDCDCGRNTVRFLQPNGSLGLIFLQLQGDRYYGGSVRPEQPLGDWDPGHAHMWCFLPTLLNIAAEIVRTGKDTWVTWEVEGNGGKVVLGRQMPLDDLARALGAEPAAVRDYFEQLITVT
jgi:hypothetical protein